MSDEGWGFADIYAVDNEKKTASGDLEDVKSDQWRNILVLGRATKDGVYPETLALVGRARYLADELGCRVEVLLIGKNLDAATDVLRNYPINTIYQVKTDDYAPIDKTARILETVVKKRRPELILVFQSRTGDAVTAYAANRLQVGFILGASSVSVDTMERRARVTVPSADEQFSIHVDMQDYPQFVSVQRGLFRAPMEDPYASVEVHGLDAEPGRVADVKVLEKSGPPAPSLASAEKVLVAGGHVHTESALQAARDLATDLGAVFGVTRSLVEQGLAAEEELVGRAANVVAPRLLVTVGATGSLDFREGITGEPILCAVGCREDDPITQDADYFIAGPVEETVQAVRDALA